MKRLILFLSVLFCNLTLIFNAKAATNHEAVFWANDFGMRLAKIKQPQDIMKYMNFAGTNASIVQNEISNNKIMIPELTYKVYITQIFMLDAKKKKTIIDFQHYKNNKLSLNGKSISLKPTKTFNDYLVEIEKILNQSPKNVSLIDLITRHAHAQSEGGLAHFIASFFSAASDTKNLDWDKLAYLDKANKDEIAEVLINAYALEADRALKEAKKKRSSSYTSLRFLCENKVMAGATEVTVRDGNVYVKNDGKSVKSVPGGGYRFYYGPPITEKVAIASNKTSCSATVNDNGVVEDKFGRNPEFCPSKGLNIFNDPGYLGAFPKVASLCCQQEGCYQKVTTARDAIINKMSSSVKATEETYDAIEMAPDVQKEQGVD